MSEQMTTEELKLWKCEQAIRVLAAAVTRGGLRVFAENEIDQAMDTVQQVLDVSDIVMRGAMNAPRDKVDEVLGYLADTFHFQAHGNTSIKECTKGACPEIKRRIKQLYLN